MNEPIRFEESMTLDERIRLQMRLQWSMPAVRRQRYQQLALIPFAAWFFDARVRNVLDDPRAGLPMIGLTILAVGLVFVLTRAFERWWYRKRLIASRVGGWPIRSEWIVAEDQLELISDDGSRSVFHHRQLQSVRCVGEHLVIQWSGRYTAQAHRAQFPVEALARMRAAAPSDTPWPDDHAT